MQEEEKHISPAEDTDDTKKKKGKSILETIREVDEKEAQREAEADVTTDAATAERIVRRRQVARAVEEFPALALEVLVEDNYCDEDLQQLKKLLLLLAKEADGK